MTTQRHRTTQHKIPRQRMRPWLINHIDNGSIPGLVWMDKDQMIFRVPWKHGSRQNWKQSDANLFILWAEHRGKYHPDKDPRPNTKKFKATFRCALNSLPDCEEIVEKSRKSGQDAFKIYKFNGPEKRKSRRIQREPEETSSNESSLSEQRFFPENNDTCSDQEIPKLEELFGDTLKTSFPSGGFYYVQDDMNVSSDPKEVLTAQECFNQIENCFMNDVEPDEIYFEDINNVQYEEEVIISL